MLLLQGSLKELNLPKNIFVGGYQGVYKPKSGVKTGLTGAVQRVSGHWAVGLFTQRRHLHHWLSFIFCIVIIQSPDVTTSMTQKPDLTIDMCSVKLWYDADCVMSLVVCFQSLGVTTGLILITRCQSLPVWLQSLWIDLTTDMIPFTVCEHGQESSHQMSPVVCFKTLDFTANVISNIICRY